jgi:hypothetical protein
MRRLGRKTILVVALYQIVPLFLTAVWIMPAFFELFGVDWNDTTWRSYAACIGGWIIMEVPLGIWLIVKKIKDTNES